MLYIVSTPIGNMEDITYRAVQTLKESDYVLAEDTRRTAKIFARYDISKKLVSYNDMNKERKTPAIIKDLLEGKNISQVSDSGTPGISDPGFYLVREAISKNIPVSPIPGATAAISALVCSGLPTDRFTFYGFLPKQNAKRKKVFEEALTRGDTAIFYESPHRIRKSVQDLVSLSEGCKVVIAREMTKRFEEFISGTAKEISERLAEKTIKGEIVFLVKK